MILKTQSLLPATLKIIRDKGTECSFTGKLTENEQPGTYLCRQCGLALFRSASKFHSGCGWPSFDGEISGAVKQEADQDGKRTEILCARCAAHLGHVFTGERFTAQNIRHCVNSASLDFVSDPVVKEAAEALFAAGCFWGVEYLFKKLPGVLKTEVGYMGGSHYDPTYQAVCTGDTGHFEVVRVLYDPSQIDYKKVTQYFFEIHDATQVDGQGPDRGTQYLSAIFYYTKAQQKIAQAVITELEQKAYRIVTQVLPSSIFWPAEEYHQDYYQKTGKTPYCHRYVQRF